MADYDNTNRGAIFKNDQKKTDSHPDFTGSLNVDGIEFWVNAWKRKAGASEKSPALTFSVKMKDSAPKQDKTVSQSQTSDDFEDDIPF